MIIMVTGDRDYKDRGLVNGVLGAVIDRVSLSEDITILDGACPYGGADQMAYEYGSVAAGIHHKRFAAKERTVAEYHARNQAMVDYGPDVCVAFKDVFDFTLSKGGTEDTVRRAKAAGIPCIIVSAL